MLLGPGGKFPGKTNSSAGPCLFHGEKHLSSPGPSSLQNGTEKESPIKLQIHLHWLMGANTNNPWPELCPRRNCPSITIDCLEQTALVPPEESL